MSGRTVGGVQVFATAPDRDGVSWRVELRDRGEVRVYRVTGRSVAQTPLRHPRTVDQLGSWLFSRGLDVVDLYEI